MLLQQLNIPLSVAAELAVFSRNNAYSHDCTVGSSQRFCYDTLAVQFVADDTRAYRVAV